MDARKARVKIRKEKTTRHHFKGPDWYQNYKNTMRIKAEKEQQREEEATAADLS